MNLENKIIVLTGAGGLIGNATLDYLLKSKATVVATDVKPIENKTCDFFQTDVTSPEAIDELIKIVVQKYGRIDGLVNLAYPRTADWGAFFEKNSVSVLAEKRRHANERCFLYLPASTGNYEKAR